MNYIENYLDWKKEQGEVNSEVSIRNYRSKLHMFERYLKDIHVSSIEDYGKVHVEEFIKDMSQGNPMHSDDNDPKTKSASTRKNYLAIIHNFTRYLDEVEGIEKTITIQKVKSTKTQNLRDTPVKWLQPRQEVAILGELENDPMYYAIVRIMLDLGLRISEVLSMNLEDYDASGARVESRPIKVKGKGNSERNLFIPKKTAKAIRDWEREREELVPDVINRLETKLTRRPIGMSEEAWKKRCKNIEEKIKTTQTALFVSREGGRMTPRSVQDRLTKIQKRLEHSHDVKELTPHMFRHTCFKKMAIKGASPSDIVKISGHRSLDMVLRYTESTVSDAMKFLDDEE